MLNFLSYAAVVLAAASAYTAEGEYMSCLFCLSFCCVSSCLFRFFYSLVNPFLLLSPVAAAAAAAAAEARPTDTWRACLSVSREFSLFLSLSLCLFFSLIMSCLVFINSCSLCQNSCCCCLLLLLLLLLLHPPVVSECLFFFCLLISHLLQQQQQQQHLLSNL